jgi:Fic family protein
VRPPFEINPKAADLLSRIERLLGRYEGVLAAPPNPMLRRSHRIRTIHASLAIEGNTLSEDQISAVLDGKRIIAPERDLLEVRNAIACYEKLLGWNPASSKHLLAAHKQMMNGLVDRPGTWRTRSVGIAKGNIVTHIAPPYDRVPGLMNSVLEWLNKETVVPAPIRAAVCHYELEFIHPFEDGNGRMGRLWHSLILCHYHPIFAQVPIESAIRTHQAEYYAVLGRCDKAGNSTEFVEFALALTLEALAATTALPISKMSGTGRIETARQRFGSRTFTRKDYLTVFPTLSSATASRDLQQAVFSNQLIRQGDKATACYQFKART